MGLPQEVTVVVACALGYLDRLSSHFHTGVGQERLRRRVGEVGTLKKAPLALT